MSATLVHPDLPGGKLDCGELVTRRVKITPSLAQYLLERNYEGQRNLREQHVANLAADMFAGTWHESVDAIGLTSDGRVINGQHRLAAVKLSGVTVGADLKTGLTAADFATIDMGSSRTLADYFASVGVPDAVTAAALSNAVWKVEQGTPIRSLFSNSKARPTVDAVMDMWVENAEQLGRIVRTSKAVRARILKGSVKAYGLALYLIEEFGRGGAEEFERQLLDQDTVLAVQATSKITGMFTGTANPKAWMLVGALLQAYETWVSGKQAIGSYNKAGIYVDRYDKRIAEALEKERA